MYDLNIKLNEFYHNIVRLKQEDREKLRGYKRTNVDRINRGLDKINEEESKSYPYPTIIEQGSIPMHTANRNDDNDYDIDIALIFPKDELPANTLESRKLIEKALTKNAGNFSRQPEARTNAVTVWYAEGYHVDFAIYRSTTDFWGTENHEHAGADWSNRDARAILNWFNERVNSLSPSKTFGASVEAGQFRKIVRLIKRFSRSRENWSLPGGLVISVLAAECYQSDSFRDDVALANTMKSIHNRLERSKQVYNPVDSTCELTDKQKYKHQVNRLGQKLKQAVKRLEKLDESDCTEKKAKKVWKWIFNSDFWEQEETSSEVGKQLSTSSSYRLHLQASLHVKQNGFRLNSNVPSGAMKIPKKMWLKFTAKTNVPFPYNVRWTVENEGDEAEAADDLTHERFDGGIMSDNISHWERTLYKGQHKLICRIEKNGSVLIQKVFIVKIKR